MIGGMARVTQDVPPFMICAGDPAFVSGLNSVGLSRAGMPVEERSELKKAFRILYRSGLPLQEAISTMEQELTSSWGGSSQRWGGGGDRRGAHGTSDAFPA